MSEPSTTRRNPVVVSSDLIWGSPAIEGTRIPVGLVFDFFIGGQSIDDVLLAYPHVHRSDLVAILEIASELVAGNARKLDLESEDSEAA